MAKAKATPLVMPETYQICTWHMRQNAMKYLRYLYKEDDSEFAEHLHAFINDILEEDEFLSAWDAMVSKYDLEGNNWIQLTFQVREKWAKVYVKSTFCASSKIHS